MIGKPWTSFSEYFPSKNLFLVSEHKVVQFLCLLVLEEDGRGPSSCTLASADERLNPPSPSPKNPASALRFVRIATIIFIPANWSRSFRYVSPRRLCLAAETPSPPVYF